MCTFLCFVGFVFMLRHITDDEVDKISSISFRNTFCFVCLRAKRTKQNKTGCNLEEISQMDPCGFVFNALRELIQECCYKNRQMDDKPT